MDETEATAAAAAPPPSAVSQSRLSSVLLLLLAAAVVFRIATAVFDRGNLEGGGGGMVRWEPREKAARLALSASKPILYDFTAAWCGPCKLLDKDWDDPTIANTVNSAFVPARVVDRAREDGDNPPDVAELQKRYEVSGFPTLVAAAPDGRLIVKLEGYRGRAALVEFLQEARKK
ncbi:MAG TPA: thioredoxin domain-containing protein [Thermoanaerobaculia bacterium]|jgi:thiol-disulfide isomerase/thioredoxin